jgi:GNAT superfamily N-acetyltransferase
LEITLANIQYAAQILSLQKLAYQSEAAIYQDYSIPPLTQTIEEIKGEFDSQVFLKAVHEKDIIGSVRAYSDGYSCFIGRLIVHPKWQGKGIGTKLMITIETYFSNVQRYELFAGTKSEGNIRLCKRLGYKPFKEQVVTDFITFIYMEKLASNAI